MELVVIFVLGLSAGSFINVCIYRIPRGMSVITPRSFCPACKTTLRWYELVPVLSYLLLRRKCRTCQRLDPSSGARISLRHPIVELLCGVVFVFLYSLDGPSTDFMAHALLFTLLLSIFVIDWKHLIIPNGIIITGLVLGIAMYSLVSLHDLITAVGSGLLCAAVMFVFRWIGNAAFNKETMGMGDIKLSALIGLFVGIENFLFALWAAAVIGCLYWLVEHFIMGSQKDMKLPFGSFLSLTSFVIFSFNPVIYL